MGRPKVYDESLRQRLIDEALLMLSESGYHSISLRILTKNAGTSTNAVYTLFGSKEALMAEVIVRNLQVKLNTELDRHAEEDPVRNLIHIAKYYRALALNSPLVFGGAVAAVKDAHGDGGAMGRGNSEIRAVDNQVFAPILRACQQIAEQNPGQELDAKEMALSFWAMIHGLITLEVSGMLGRQTDDISSIFAKSLTVLYLGWTTPQSAERAEELVAHTEGPFDTGQL